MIGSMLCRASGGDTVRSKQPVRFLLGVALALSGCSAGVEDPKKDVSSPPDLRPIYDSAPYLCDLIPEAAFRNITGLRVRLDPQTTGVPGKHGLCLAYAPGREAPLGVDWSFVDGERAISRIKAKYGDYNPRRLPSEFGRGFIITFPVAGNPRPLYVIALFRCGGRQPWLSIDVAPVVKGRDPVRDMTEFMRIAQRRFGQLHHCTPKSL
jgi:hypothetical protein